jgi:hypothetical protein
MSKKRHVSAETRAKMSAAQHARHARSAVNVILDDALAQSQPALTNGLHVEHQIVVQLGGTEHVLTVGEARQLREMLTEAVPTS